ncbi:uncharacterized protein LOC115694334 [Syzygium oleosum]|uniref:uncharacterized protein LOC115694334 n=1 Tax=Syzygium oleosum TaxID=219896 RepID=UPI0011D20E15|nr:uncharacterized protein LOC115694334 [Syzygium oleosum]
MAKVTMEEIKAAVFQMGATKAPGPDGLNGQFFQKHWEHVNQDVYGMVESFFNTGLLDMSLNRTHIVVIPKVMNPESINQYRPISLCNFSYKIISKVMVNRLKQWLPDLISPEQSAFVSGRQIQDNILIVQEVLHQLRVRKRMGFCERWVNLVRQCISTVSYGVRVNGETLPYFNPTRGIRQGDPLSPYLFIIMANALSSLMHKAVEDGTIKGIKLNRWCPTLSHLLFADDAIFFLDGSTQECQNVANIMNQYCQASGQAVNLNKSGIFFSKGCPQQVKNRLAEELRVPIIEKMGKYLGIPSDWGQSKKEMFAWVLARVHSKLEGWNARLMSKAGKEILIKTVVQALPQYAMSIFKIPISVCKAIERRIAAFWWKQKADTEGIHWKSWETLKKRKDLGGLGFRDLITLNKAILGKQAWRLVHEPEALWSQVLKGLYYPQGQFWHAKKGHRPSWGWQSLIVGREAIEKDARWRVGDGRKIKTREDVWLPIGKIGGPARQNEPQQVADLINQETHEWKEQALKEIFQEEVVNQILLIPISTTPVEDKLIWTGTKSGDYTVKGGYNRIRMTDSMQDNNNLASSSYQPPRNLWTSIWQLPVYPKIRFFLWSLCQNALPTRENLYKRKCVPDPLCPICRNHPETTEHLFLLCKWTTQVWSDYRICINIQPAQITRTEAWLATYLAIGLNSETSSPLARIADCLWQIWKGRNALIFRKRKPNPWLVVEEAINTGNSYTKFAIIKEKTRGQKLKEAPEFWKPPEKGSRKWNVDAAWSADSGNGSVAGLCRDHEGRMIDGFAKGILAPNSSAAETLAIRECLQHELKKAKHRDVHKLKEGKYKEVHELGSTTVEFNSDCSILPGSVFNAANAMQCPVCQAVEEGVWRSFLTRAPRSSFLTRAPRSSRAGPHVAQEDVQEPPVPMVRKVSLWLSSFWSGSLGEVSGKRLFDKGGQLMVDEILWSMRNEIKEVY